jgi:hypothetical protein
LTLGNPSAHDIGNEIKYFSNLDFNTPWCIAFDSKATPSARLAVAAPIPNLAIWKTQR